MQQNARFGIYLNASENKAVRINSPYWIPEEPAWVFLTPEVNATILKIRDTAREKNSVADAEGLTWGIIPMKD